MVASWSPPRAAAQDGATAIPGETAQPSLANAKNRSKSRHRVCAAAGTQPATRSIAPPSSRGGEDKAKIPPNGLLIIVAARRGGRWQFVSFSNTPTRGRNPK